MLNIVIPMAGLGSRFEEAGYTTYKPFLPIKGKTMIERVVENVVPNEEHQIVIITRTEFENEVRRLLPHAKIVILTEMTEGAACTVLLGMEKINPADPMMIVNSDQLVDWDVNAFLKEMNEGALDTTAAGILTLPANEEKYSYAQLIRGPLGLIEVIRTAEKQVISQYGTVGIYWFAQARVFADAADAMIRANDRFKNEFYVCPVFNYIPRHKLIRAYNVPAEAAHFLGAPREYEEYLATL